MNKNRGHRDTELERAPFLANASLNIHPFDVNMDASNTQGQALLAGLVGFIRPFINPYASTAAGVTSARRDHFDSRAKRACSGAQGEELLSALGRFVKNITAIDGDDIAKGKAKLVTARGKFTPDREIAPPYHDAIYKSIKTAVLPPWVVNAVHQHIFNDMPIRMLAFDNKGRHPRLVGRNEIAEEIKSCISEYISEYHWVTVNEYSLHNLIKEIGRYAILSHTWFQGKPGDVVYGDWKDRELNPEGNSKIVNFCKVAARKHGVVYGWMDTICIDKSSSTELDESIRLMFRWYQKSYVCITYLADTSTIADMHSDKWFTRGWTLQELLAPQNMVFYGNNWSFLAQNDVKEVTFSSKFNAFSEAIQSQIFQATTIGRDEMAMCFKHPVLLPISRVFQLASRRKVTRKEDSVYSLMGLLGVTISVAYGEGLPAAFRRLVREIMVTKKNFLDIFNHSHKEQLIPSSIIQYEQRSSLFDQMSFHSSTALHKYKPIEPIYMTHLGVHVPVLLLPLFDKSISEAPIPSETDPLSVGIPEIGYGDWCVLKRNNISAQFIANFKAEATILSTNVIFLGILNFWKGDSAYQTTNGWLCVSFRLKDKSAPMVITDIDAKDLYQISGPLVQSWTKKCSLGYNEMQEQDLQEMGMQVITLNLQ